MDYKNVIKSRETRENILRALRFIPDKQMVKLQYRIKTGRRLNLNNPQRYTEKLQWYKLNYRDSLMVQCVDKYEVRQYVEKQGRGDLLTKCYGVFDRPEDIDFELLPDQFVLKDTLGGGGNSVILCQNKSEIDWQHAMLTMKRWCTTKIVRDGGREWPYYSGRNHRIIVEEFLECPNGDLPDYKFFCFNGEPFFLYLMQNYTWHHENGILGFLTPDFRLLPVCRQDFAPMKMQPIEPENYGEMLEIAKDLSAGFPHVRVDLYNVSAKIYFGEMTFFNASGYFKFDPDSFDYELGKAFVLPNIQGGGINDFLLISVYFISFAFNMGATV